MTNTADLAIEPVVGTGLITSNNIIALTTFYLVKDKIENFPIISDFIPAMGFLLRNIFV